MAYREFIDYDGPTGLFVATGSKILPLGSAEGISAVAQSAMLTSLGATDRAKRYSAQVQRSLQAAHQADIRP